MNVSNDPNHWENKAEEAWSLAAQMTEAHATAIMVVIEMRMT